MGRTRYQSEPKSGQLCKLLYTGTTDLTALFQIRNIAGDIKANMNKFVKFLKTRKTMLKQLIQFATRSRQESLNQSQQERKCCFCATQFLTNQDDALMDIFFQSQKQQDDQKQLEIEKLLYLQQEIPSGNDNPAPQQILIYFMDYLVQGNIQSQASNGYFAKAVSQIIRKRGIVFMEFLQQHPNYIQILIKSLYSPSLITVLVKILAIDDKGKYQIADMKKKTIRQIFDGFLSSVQDSQITLSISIFIEQAFQIIKNKYFEYPEDYVNCLNYMVSQKVISELLKKLFDNQQTQSCIKIQSITYLLQILLRKKNSQLDDFNQTLKDRRQDPRQMLQSQYILQFQFHQLFSSFIKILNLLNLQNIDNFTKHQILSLLIQIVKAPEIFPIQKNSKSLQNSIKLDYQTIILKLLYQLGIQNKQNSVNNGGIHKTSIFNLLKLFIQKCPQQILNAIVQSFLQQNNLNKYFPCLKLIENFQNLTSIRKINNDPNVGIQSNILFHLNKRIPTLFQNIKNIFNIDLGWTKIKYEKQLGQNKQLIKNISQSDMQVQSPVKRINVITSFTNVSQKTDQYYNDNENSLNFKKVASEQFVQGEQNYSEIKSLIKHIVQEQVLIKNEQKIEIKNKRETVLIQDECIVEVEQVVVWDEQKWKKINEQVQNEIQDIKNEQLKQVDNNEIDILNVVEDNDKNNIQEVINKQIMKQRVKCFVQQNVQKQIQMKKELILVQQTKQQQVLIINKQHQEIVNIIQKNGQQQKPIHKIKYSDQIKFYLKCFDII